LLLVFFIVTYCTEIYTLSLRDALPISPRTGSARVRTAGRTVPCARARWPTRSAPALRWTRSAWATCPGQRWEWRAARCARRGQRSEEHTSELQSREKLICRLLL